MLSTKPSVALKNIKEGEEARGQEEEEKHHPYSQRSNVNIRYVSVCLCGRACVCVCKIQMRTWDNSSVQSLLMSLKEEFIVILVCAILFILKDR